MDPVGLWSEVKLAIIRDYLPAYSKLVTGYNFYHLYIDGFAGFGLHESRATGDVIQGSPLIALNTVPPFKEYHFIDKDPARVAQLRSYAPDRRDVHVHEGDCNQVVPDILPRARRQDYKRALCFLDPYGIDIHWGLVQSLGELKSAEIFLNFMVMDMNMNVLLHHPEKALASQVERMNRFWGDESWRTVIYTSQTTLFGTDTQVKLADSNAKIAEAYRKRLKEVAGFEFVPPPLPFLNDIGATIYYLFFASPNKTGHKIVGEIFEKYRRSQGL
ncbi:MAG: three-Cys-motif partner protein TcmP [Acidobacteriia bacterium]|nr:three-Cys-motif partner protein TcmP [Terriglobia bacterium]